ncbi:uncharacterized protein GVI51_H06479 [Nakaseomyces glabratus]|uniref:uncharacterized protein n=1 Tax=Candida glabrata TaxID=5478 RepID=UPI00138CC4EC|nr:hypothetical protein J7294_02349 [Nakaseomyces glabratus]KAH7605892.1 hypothetical protein J7293_02341 [Nakaseomyces glabratus]QHS66725.1 uncharacterized protein GVI51_H06479 [Nakaseomyces glabratus]
MIRITEVVFRKRSKSVHNKRKPLAAPRFRRTVYRQGTQNHLRLPFLHSFKTVLRQRAEGATISVPVCRCIQLSPNEIMVWTNANGVEPLILHSNTKLQIATTKYTRIQYCPSNKFQLTRRISWYFQWELH